VRVAAGGLDVGVAQQLLYLIEASARIDQAGGKAVPQVMDASMKRGAPYFDLWALATKADINEEELLSLAKNHFTPR